jgi:hypothetical protein
MSFKRILFSIFAVGVCMGSYAQLNNNCPGCIINQAAFGASPAASAVGLFPDSIVVTQDDSVNLDVTYMMPQSIQTSGVTATVTEVKILGIDGTAPLPAGLSLTCDQSATNCAYYPQTQRFGCVKICGLTHQPATNGWVAAKITVAGTGEALGTTETEDQDITVYYKILPDTSACHTVCFQNKVNSGCDSATIGIEAGIDISCPDPILNPCSFNWAYGNGQTGSGLALQPVTYSAPGTYPVTLTAVTQQYIITAATFTVPTDPLTLGLACFTGCSWYNNICNGDGINPSANNFSLNITIGSNTYSMSGGSSLTSTFTNLHDTVTTQAIALSVSDACLLTSLSAGLTTVTITGAGSYPWAINGSDATGTITVALVTKDSVSYTDSVYIYTPPVAPLISSSADSICAGDSIMLSIGSAFAPYTIHWFQDSVYLNNLDNDTTIYVHTSGNYRATVTNPTTQCMATSADTAAIVVSGTVPTGGGIVHANTVVYVNPYTPGAYVEWYYDSTLVTGQNGSSMPYVGIGTYYATLYPPGFPQCSFTTGVLAVLPSGVEETQADVYNLSVFPNPNTGVFSVKVNVLTPGSVTISLTDMLGRSVYDNTVLNQSGEVRDNINVSSLAKGVYTLVVDTDKGKAAKQVVIE